MTLRKILLTTHLCVGVMLAPVLCVLGVTGAMLAFQPEIEDAVNARLTHVQPAGRPRTVAQLVDDVGRLHPGAELGMVRLPMRDDRAYEMMMQARGAQPLGLYVDPYRGRVLGTMDDAWTMQKVSRLHRQLMSGPKGNAVVLATTIGLIYLCITGLILWWPGKVYTIRRTARGWRLAFDAHAALGFYAWGGFLLFALSGLVLHWERPSLTVASRLTGVTPWTPFTGRVPACDASSALAAEALIRVASEAAPGARPTFLMAGDASGRPAHIALRYPEDRTPAGRTHVWVDVCTGAVVSSVDARTAPLAFRATALWDREIHTGDIFGWPTRILAALLSLTLPLVAVTGPLLWFLRRRQKKGGPTARQRIRATETADDLVGTY